MNSYDAVTPYNFIPLSGRIHPGEEPPQRDRFYTDRHTGWFDIEVAALTPIYTRAALGANDIIEKQPTAFFHRPDGAFILPGSGLRGMIRSTFEMMTLSRMEFVSKRRLFYRSFAEKAGNGNIKELYDKNFRKDRLRAGILIRSDNGWKLKVSRKTQKGFILVYSDDLPKIFTVRRIGEFPHEKAGYVEIGDGKHAVLDVPIGKWQEQGEKNGYLIIPGADVMRKCKHPPAIYAKECSETGPGADVAEQRKYFQAIIKPDENDCEIYDIPADVYDDYLDWGRMAHGSRFGTIKAPRKLVNGSPAFALLDEDGKIFVIGANMMMPMRYDYSIADVAARSCKGDAPEMDMAQSVFGRISEGKSDRKYAMVRGRVFFEDALCKSSKMEALLDPKNPVRFPDVLSAPKPTSFQVYLDQSKVNDDIYHWNEPQAEIRGHKLYWHRPHEAAQAALHTEMPPKASVKVTTKIEPLRAGVVFRGRIRFENLTDKELGALYASIQLPDGMAHHFGMGKNLGLGSVRVNITETCLLDMLQRMRGLAPDAGRIPEEQCKALLQKSYQYFVDSIYPGEHSLWKNARMKALSLLLYSGSPLPSDQTKQVGIEKGNPQWKDRWILPTAAEVVGESWKSWKPRDVFPFPE